MTGLPARVDHAVNQPRLQPDAYPAHFARVAPISRTQRVWTEADGALPTMFYGHGAPPLLDDALWLDQLWQWSSALPKPRAVLMVSAHWESAPLALSATAAATPLVYDFGGFEQRFYDMQYRSPDAAALAAQVTAVLPDTEPVHQHTSRGLDHGAWVPMMAMYPLADVPVLQLSLPTHDPARLLEIGRRLQPLREQGVLVMGSGFLTHGLPFLNREHWSNPDAAAPGWSRDFDAWAQETIAAGDVEALAAYDRAPGMPYAHPTPEHFSPLFVALGASGHPEQRAEASIDGFWMGLSKRSYQLA